MFALFLIVFIAVGCVESKEAEKPYIDFLTLEYLSVEQKLWGQINSDVGSNELYSIVLDEHKDFIRSDFGVSSNTLAIYIPSGILIDNLRNVNDLFYNTSSMLINTAPIETVDIYYVHTILRDAITFSNHVFQEAIRAEFWEKGKNVSPFRLDHIEDLLFTNLFENIFSTSSTVANWKHCHQR